MWYIHTYICIYIYIYIQHIYVYILIYIQHTYIYSCDETVCQCMTIYMLPSWGLSILLKKLTAVTHVMQSSSNELSTLVSGKAKCKQMKAKT